MRQNQIANVRPTSTFDNYVPVTETQKQAKALFLKVAQGLCGMTAQFNAANGLSPFDNAKILSLVSGPGRGKTHLMEALINYVKQNNQGILKHMYLHRDNFVHTTMTSVADYTFDTKPIILVDDMYSNAQSVDSIGICAVEGFMHFIPYIYDNRCLVITTSNFPIQDGIARMVARQDKVGRITSRLNEIMGAHAGEIVIDGGDYREKLASDALKRRQAGGGFSPDTFKLG